jgi:glycosyltransferase involved in cell wall biosynthesis
MRIALVSEGTYPYAIGGVSTWCDQLIRGLPEHRWTMVALTGDDSEHPLWTTPDNLDGVQRIPLWGPAPAGPHRPGRWRGAGREPGAGFASSYGALLEAMLAPHDPRSPQAMVARSRFLLALRGIFEYADSGGDLSAALMSNAALAQLVAAWRDVRPTDLTLADALEAAHYFGCMLRPFSVPPVRCDIVHSSMNGLSMLAAMAAKWRHGTPLVMSEHGIYLRERYLSYLDEPAAHAVKALMLSFFRSLAGAGYLVADALAPHSSYNRRWQLQNGADPDRMWTMYNGVETAEFPVAESEPDTPTVVFMGRINPLKDLHTLIRAFAYVRAQVPGARLRIFGVTPPADQAYAQSCRRLIRDLNLTDAVTMEGGVDSPVIAYHAATIVALTSVSEGFPVTLIEAMACGRPIVCTNVGGVREAVTDAGIVVTPRDHLAVARACVTLLQDDEMRQRMAKAARSRVLQLFTLAESLNGYRRIYDHLTGEPVETPDPVEACRPRALGRVRVASVHSGRPFVPGLVWTGGVR